jgi:cell division protein FtsN
MAQASRKKDSPCRSRTWFIAGLAIGAGVVGFFGSQDAQNIKQKIQARMGQVGNSQPTANPAPKPRFDFYTILPEMEVVLPEEDIPTPAKPEPPTEKIANATTSHTPTVYLVQMGSFKNYKDADRLKAKLGFLGIESDIQSVTIANAQGKSSVHRVRGGPYSQHQAQSLHQTLKDNQIRSMVIRVKQ